jgi:hypothetical protein
VDRIIELTGRMTAGTRPYRSVVGVDFGLRELNATVKPREVAVLECIGLTSFATPGSGKSG